MKNRVGRSKERRKNEEQSSRHSANVEEEIQQSAGHEDLLKIIILTLKFMRLLIYSTE